MNAEIDRKELDIEDAIETINPDYCGELLLIACKALSEAGNSKGEHYSPTRILYDLLEASAFADVEDCLLKDYRR